MSSTVRTTAAPRTLKVGEKSYRISPLRDRDYGEFEAWVQDRIIELAKRNLEGLTPDERQFLLGKAYDKATKVTISSPEAMNAMATVDGAVKLTWLSLRHEHPDITEGEVLALFADPQALSDAMELIERTEKLGGGQTSTGNPPKRKAPKRKARPKRKKK